MESRTRWQTVQDVAFTLLRIMAALMLMQHGLQKLVGAFGGFGGTPGARAELDSLMGLAAILEVFVAALVGLGLFTRVAAFLLSGEMATAYFKAHAPRGFFPILNHGELVVLFCFIFLFVAAHGPGPFSLDALLRGRWRGRRAVARGEAVSG